MKLFQTVFMLTLAVGERILFYMQRFGEIMANLMATACQS